jgi:hypothetical protein
MTVVVACLWCETSLKPETATCPECGLQCPAGATKTTSMRGSRRTARRTWPVALALVVVPLMLSAAYAERGGDLALDPTANASPAAVPVSDLVQPPPIYADPLQRAVWINGVMAVRHALAQPAYVNFAGSYIDVAAGHVVSFCGEVAGTSGYDSASGAQRFLSVFGQSRSTMIEGSDASFEVLWSRVCAQDESPA